VSRAGALSTGVLVVAAAAQSPFLRFAADAGLLLMVRRARLSAFRLRGVGVAGAAGTRPVCAFLHKPDGRTLYQCAAVLDGRATG
jgi:hypothetical protein